MDNMFEIDGISAVGPALIAEILRAYRSTRPMPGQNEPPLEIPENGCGLAGMPAIWRTITEQSAHLATPWMSGHMDTAPHPAAALTQGLVAGRLCCTNGLTVGVPLSPDRLIPRLL
jgi:hypothetical protein